MKRISMKRWLMVFLMALCFIAAPMHTSAKTVTLPVVGNYGQTDARLLYNMINRFRTGSDAWYWSSDNKRKINVSGSLHQLTYSYELEKTAMLRAIELSVYYKHVRPNLDTCFTAFDLDAYSMAENIAVGSSSPSAVFDSWLEAGKNYEGQGQRRTMLSNDFNAVGIGHVVVNGVHYWVQAFAYTKDKGPVTVARNGNRTVNVEVDSSLIRNIVLTTDEDAVAIDCGGTGNLPQVQATLLTTAFAATDGSRSIPLDVSCRWKCLDPSLVQIRGGRLMGLRSGKTTLLARACGKTLSIPVTVKKKKSWTGPYR